MNVGEPHNSDPSSQPSEPATDSPAASPSPAQPARPTAAEASADAGADGDAPTSAATGDQQAQPPAAAGEVKQEAGELAQAGTAESAQEQAGEAEQSPQRRPGPLAAARGPLAARGLGTAKPASPQAAASSAGGGGATKAKKKKHPRPRLGGERPQEKTEEAAPPESGESVPSESAPSTPVARKPGRVAVPNVRGPLSADMEAELEAQLAAADVESLLSGPAGMVEGRTGLAEGQRVHATVLKIHGDSVFVSLGGPDEGVIPFVQFETEPTPGQSVEVVVRGYGREDRLYLCMLPGQTIEVSDLEDIEEGAVVEATVTKTNSGGLECSVGGAQGFIPISQISEYRVEETEEFVGQKMVCLVTQCNPRQRKLVLSRRAILEREREERRKKQLESLNVGDTVDGTVRSIKDFGAFVDLGGCEGMLHISKLSWDRVDHPSDVLEEGQKVKVKIDKIDEQTGKISLSYRDLLENPWDTVEQDFPIGQVVRGTVSRIANFGAFVRLAPGVEGLVHISELAHHRVSRVQNVVKEGDEVEVKVQSIDRDSQRIGLSLKAAQAAPAAKTDETKQEETEEPQREPAIKRQHAGPLRGGTERPSGGERFGLRW